MKAKLPLLPETASVIADVQVRNRGTIGGSLVHADPSADLPATALALDAEIQATGPGGQRNIKVRDFFVGLLTTAVGPDEIVTEIRFPLPPARTGAAYLKVPNKASHDAIVGVAAVLTVGDDGRCRQASVALTGVSPVPFRATRAEEAPMGRAPEEGAMAEAADKAASGVKAISDLHASGEYRLHLANVHTRLALKLAAARAQE